MKRKVKNQSNPFSTGGGGVNFETRVQAAFVTAMITRSCVPCLGAEMRASEIKFQSKYTGVNTDDFVLNASDQIGSTASIYAQIKHEITISESNTIFAEVICSAWQDFCNTDFDAEHHIIALITGPLPKTDVNNVLPLLEWAKYSADADEFLTKANTEGFTSKDKTTKLNAIRSQLISANDGKAITDEEFWCFLKSFQIISYDLDSKHSTIATLLCSLLAERSSHPAHTVLSSIVTFVQEYNQNAGTIALNNNTAEIESLFNKNTSTGCDNDIRKFQERSDRILESINNTIAGTHIARAGYLAELEHKAFDASFVFVTGQRGSGKSGLVKNFVQCQLEGVPVFYLRAEDLDKSHLNEVFTAIGMNASIGQIEAQFSLIPQKVLVGRSRYRGEKSSVTGIG